MPFFYALEALCGPVTGGDRRLWIPADAKSFPEILGARITLIYIVRGICTGHIPTPVGSLVSSLSSTAAPQHSSLLGSWFRFSVRSIDTPFPQHPGVFSSLALGSQPSALSSLVPDSSGCRPLVLTGLILNHKIFKLSLAVKDPPRPARTLRSSLVLLLVWPIVFKLNKADRKNVIDIQLLGEQRLRINLYSTSSTRLFNVGRDVQVVRQFAMTEETLRTAIMLKDVLRRKETSRH